MDKQICEYCEYRIKLRHAVVICLFGHNAYVKCQISHEYIRFKPVIKKSLNRKIIFLDKIKE